MKRGEGQKAETSQDTTQGELELPIESETSANTSQLPKADPCTPSHSRAVPPLLSSLVDEAETLLGLSDTDNQTVLSGTHFSSPTKKAPLVSPC